MIYKVPEFNDKAFTCPYCQTYAEQNWDTKYLLSYSDMYELQDDYML